MYELILTLKGHEIAMNALGSLFYNDLKDYN